MEEAMLPVAHRFVDHDRQDDLHGERPAHRPDRQRESAMSELAQPHREGVAELDADKEMRGLHPSRLVRPRVLATLGPHALEDPRDETERRDRGERCDDLRRTAIDAHHRRRDRREKQHGSDGVVHGPSHLAMTTFSPAPWR